MKMMRNDIDHSRLVAAAVIIMLVGLVFLIHNNALRAQMGRDIMAKQYLIIENQQKILAAIDRLQYQTGGRRAR